MGHPPGAVILPRADPVLARYVAGAVHDPLGLRAELAGLLIADGPPAGQLCATAWVFDAPVERMLLVFHRSLGWSNPGGHVEYGETPATTSARELQEETGLGLEPAWDEPAVLQVSGTAHRHWSLGYLFFADCEVALHAESRAAPVSWFLLDRLPPHRAPDLGVLLRAFAPWARCVAGL